MFWEMLDLGAILNGNSRWLLVLLLVVVVLLLRMVTDLRKEVTVAREETSHNPNHAYLEHFIELNNIRLLRRVENAYRRAAEKGGSGRFDLEIRKEINQLKASTTNPSRGNNDEDADLNYD